MSEATKEFHVERDNLGRVVSIKLNPTNLSHLQQMVPIDPDSAAAYALINMTYELKQMREFIDGIWTGLSSMMLTMGIPPSFTATLDRMGIELKKKVPPPPADLDAPHGDTKCKCSHSYAHHVIGGGPCGNAQCVCTNFFQAEAQL